jgi:hypothetical protein
MKRPISLAIQRAVSPALALLLLALLGCGGKHNASLPGTGSGPQANPGPPRLTAVGPLAVNVRQTAGVFPVKVRPQQAVPAPAFTGGIGVRQPSSYPTGAAGGRRTSDTSTLLTKQASDYDTGLPFSWVSQDFAGAEFTPNWTAANPNNSMIAYATYRFSTTGFTGTATIGINWADGKGPQDYSTYFIAVANWQLNRWEWFEGPLDGVVTLSGLAPYTAGNGDMMVMVALTGTTACTLSSVTVGPPETRGTGNSGLSGAPPSQNSPPLFGGGSLPSSVDHAPQCAPVRDQGQLGSCTAFATGAGAMDYEMGRLYGDKGWNWSTDHLKLSPRYLYLKTGADESLPCDETGRYYDKVISWIKANGIALETDAPYLPNPCDQNFGANAAADAAVIKPVTAEAVACTTDAGITQVKTLLAQGFVVPFGSLLDQAFMDWTAGSQPWSFQGPQVGGHAMCIVGYDDAKSAFKVRNSWGPDWGENGYVWIAYSSLKNPNANAMCFKVQCEYSQALVDRFFGGGGGGLAPPTGVAASDGSFSDHVHLAWNAVSGADHYKVYRDSQTTAVQTLTTTSFDDTGATDGLSHTYWVKAVKASQESGFSASDTGFVSGGGGGGGTKPTIYGVYYTPGYVGQQSTFYVDYYSDTTPSFAWTLGGCNPGSSTDESPTVSYTTAGTQTISITITNAAGPTTLSGQITVYGGGGPPTASLVPSATDGEAPLAVTLDASGSTAPNGIYRFDWDWEGDGTYDYTSGLYSIVNVQYPVGTWHTKVRVWDQTGQFSEAQVTITVTGGQQGSYTEVEDNDSFAQASSIHPGQTDTGSCGSGSGYPGYDGDIDDYWAFTVNSPVNLQITMTGNTGNLNLYLYDQFGNIWNWSENAGSNEIMQTSLPDGVYFIRVHAFSGFSDYSLDYATF